MLHRLNGSFWWVTTLERCKLQDLLPAIEDDTVVPEQSDMAWHPSSGHPSATVVAATLIWTAFDRLWGKVRVIVSVMFEPRIRSLKKSITTSVLTAVYLFATVLMPLMTRQVPFTELPGERGIAV